MSNERKSIREWSREMVAEGFSQATPAFLMQKLGKNSASDVVSKDELRAALGSGNNTSSSPSTQQTRQNTGSVGMAQQVIQDFDSFLDKDAKVTALQGQQQYTRYIAKYFSMPAEQVKALLEEENIPEQGVGFEDFFSTNRGSDLSQLLGQPSHAPQLAAGSSQSSSQLLTESLPEPLTQQPSERLGNSSDTPLTEN
jgi:hypothetical protein